MYKFIITFSLLLLGTNAQSQTISTFESLYLPSNDTFYVNYTASGTDVGFDNGLAHFPCIYDTSFGGFWSQGFAYSNKKDSVTSGYKNGYAAKTGNGYGNSNKYAVAFGETNYISLSGAAKGQTVYGFYITNSTFAYNSMNIGDLYAKKFSTKDSDWFKLIIYGKLNGQLKTDSVSFYLADFRSKDSNFNYIINDWRWIDLSKLGHVDTLIFKLKSSDNSAFGMNTPAYFCMDNFTTNENNLSIENQHGQLAHIYPNPASDLLIIDLLNNDLVKINLFSTTGQLIQSVTTNDKRTQINCSQLSQGNYFLELISDQKKEVIRFDKK